MNKRKSNFHSNRDSYLTEDGSYYCYKFYDPGTGRTKTVRYEVGKDLSAELAAMLDESDHEMELQDRYEREWSDPLFGTMVRNDQGDSDGEFKVNPWDMIADKSGSPEDLLFAEPEKENPQAAKVRRIIEEECTEAQQDLFFKHFGEGRQLEELRWAEAEKTGKPPSAQAMTNRKNKIIDKAAKSLGVERVKRHQSPKKDEGVNADNGATGKDSD